ncbi:MAG: 2-oxoacid:acceptor oxidoreductase family protein [Candidatus Bathyarchaeota archaeon]|nr:2-oxoacid:acceptor oxidoreductase family protein [Candidatus Bathyarchaeota archaeon]
MSEPIYEDVIIAGFGGQGLMFIGRLLAYSAMKEGRHVTWIPSYGPEMRGGTANCTVVVSSDPIGSPVITYPRSAIVMNQPSYDTFGPRVSCGGILAMNRSLIKPREKRKDITVIEVPASEIASELGDDRVANMVMLGAYVVARRVVGDESVFEGLRYVLGEERQHMFEVNKKAFETGKRFTATP